jgi:uncharacterized repeat protein (TIGR03803 family)
VLYRFTAGSDGAAPASNLIFDAAGNLYGTTMFGGSTHAGIVFRLAPPASEGGDWAETVLHTFGHGSDGLDPQTGLVLGNRGEPLRHYDSCTVFALTPPRWTETVLFTHRR